ncbi:PRC-barrel domain-containing protein [Natronorubrum aibiense]|uniref:Photosystem reaction center subunit H n=1 Tax=Natronorubrum aibiense TaxID=348826 RepID=A0A5P9P2F4_9EURY|nr:PRC-barrel domain-containing protein [Natronorubrum aibiense]QFU82304.1 photosystem reaction center subunit H [Natronorubrum aibiense]
MDDLLVSDLQNKSVVGIDGTEVGIVHNITMHVKSGTLNHLVVDPQGHFSSQSTGFETTDDNRLLVPINCIQVIKEHIIVSD